MGDLHKACVSYSNSAKEIFPLTTMTDNGRNSGQND